MKTLNWTHVRKLAGHRRMDSQAEVGLLRELYERVAWYKNGKTRIGGKLDRKYETPRMPYQRLLESDQISSAAKNQVEALRNQLFDLIESKPKADALKPN